MKTPEPDTTRGFATRSVGELLMTLHDQGVEEAWRGEIGRRVAAIRGGSAVGRPADDVLAELRERYP
jgi:hypothetical protein